MAAALQKYAHFTKTQFPTFGQYKAWAGADLMIKGLQMAGKNPTRAAVIKDLRSIKSYNVNGLLPQSLDFATDFGHDPAKECTWMMQAEKNGFVPVSAKPFCGHDIPGTSTATFVPERSEASLKPLATSRNASSAAGSASDPTWSTSSGACAEEDALDRHLELLARVRPGDARDAEDLVGNVARGERGSQLVEIRSVSASSSGAVLDDDEEEEPAGPTGRVFEVHDQAVADAGYGFDHGIELTGAHANTATIQRGVGTAGDDARPALGDGDPVAVAPHARKAGEVRGAVPAAVVVAPEARAAWTEVGA